MLDAPPLGQVAHVVGDLSEAFLTTCLGVYCAGPVQFLSCCATSLGKPTNIFHKGGWAEVR